MTNHIAKKITVATASVVFCLLVAMGAQTSHADVIQTYDFEDPVLHATQWNIVAVPGNNVWTSLGVDDTAVVPSAYSLGSIQGDRIIRTWNQGVTTPPTAAPVIGDGHTGGIRTDPFVLVPDASIDFLIGGGNHPWGGMDPDALGLGPASFNLEREVSAGDWETIFTATGPNANSVSAANWDASAFAGETVRFAIYDLNTGGWGHIDVDNIVYSGTVAVVPEASTFVLGILGCLSLWIVVRRRRR